MVFQDFDQIQQRRKAERQRQFRKRLIIASLSFVLLIVILLAGLYAIATVKKTGSEPTTTNNHHKAATHPTPLNTTPSPSPSPKKGGNNVTISRVQNIIDSVCNATLYKDSCQKTLNEATGGNTSIAQPKFLLHSTIYAIDQQIDKAFDKILTFTFQTPEEKAALEDCKALVSYAKRELKESMNKLNESDVENFPRLSPELNNWLSAVMSYQVACADGFPEGKIKTDVEKIFNSSQVLTSNSLAIVKQFSALVSSMPKLLGSPPRHLLGWESHSFSKKDQLPEWISHEDRRILKAVDHSTLNPNVTVAKDDSGQFKTISEALKAMPKNYTGRYIIYVKEGIYDELVTVDFDMENVTMVGDGSKKTIVTGSKSVNAKVFTLQTASFVALGNGFMARAMGFRNTAGPEGRQAVAIRVQSDRAIFVNCRFEGYQDTIFVQAHRQFYRSCVITGTIDFIFGYATVIFQNCQIFIRKGLHGQQNTITAQGRTDPFQTTGIVLQNCTIAANDDLKPVIKDFKSYLGRPWKLHSTVVVMESTIEEVIDPAGWLKWEGQNFALDTLYYAEYNNDGASANTKSRVNWPGFRVIKKEEGFNFTVGPFLQGAWINATDAPVKFGLYDA